MFCMKAKIAEDNYAICQINRRKSFGGELAATIKFIEMQRRKKWRHDFEILSVTHEELSR